MSWGETWRRATTPEERAAVAAEIRVARAKATRRAVADARELRDRLAERACESCGAPLPSLRRRLCPPCRGRRRGRPSR